MDCSQERYGSKDSGGTAFVAPVPFDGGIEPLEPLFAIGWVPPLFFLRRMIRKTIKPMIMAKPTMPPTTPPTIAPTLVPEEDSIGGGKKYLEPSSKGFPAPVLAEDSSAGGVLAGIC